MNQTTMAVAPGSKPKRRARPSTTSPSPKRQRLASDHQPPPSSSPDVLAPPSPTTPHETPVIDHTGFPHIIDAILENPNREFLISLRASSREFLHRCDSLFYRHLVFRLLSSTRISVEAPDGRIPGLEPRYPNRWCKDSEFLQALSLARIIDLHGRGETLQCLMERLQNYTKPEWVRTFDFVHRIGIAAPRYIYVVDLTRFKLERFSPRIPPNHGTERVVFAFKCDLRRRDILQRYFGFDRLRGGFDVVIHVVEQPSDAPLQEGGGEWIISLIYRALWASRRITLVDMDKVPRRWLLGPSCNSQNLEEAIKSWTADSDTRQMVEKALNLVSAEQYMAETGITRAQLELERGN